jgi:hypothetical protein
VARGVPVAGDMGRCAVATARLLGRHQLHLHRENLGRRAALPDGREFVVFRESTCESGALDDTLTLAVWFHLWAVPSEARWREWAFERESILNTVLFAGFDGYRVKLWMVDPATFDYAGLYAWHGVDAAQHYATYITTVLRPLSVGGSVGYELSQRRLDEHLASTGSAVEIPPVRLG